jgi:DNA-binding transcriptional ArsR family regulator
MAADALDRAFAALADRTRRRTIELLRARPQRAGELAESLGVSPPALSRHLRILRECRLVEATADDGDARVHVYRLRPQPFAQLRAWVERIEVLWADQLTAFADHVARRQRSR